MLTSLFGHSLLLRRRLVQLGRDPLPANEAILQVARQGFVAPLQATELLLVLVQLLPLVRELFGTLRDLLLASEDLLAELVELGDHGDIVHELLAVTVDLFESQCLIDGTEVRLLLGPAIEVEVSYLRCLPVVLSEQGAGAQVRSRSQITWPLSAYGGVTET